ncbi:DNA alkylation repair enzyme [Gemmatirosa kalamazoonensis]|uniref:DNA alkylation repair enzyme n=1 Tax=Gemmatirosa kalamazoonensis TaxID=861299 RepID=W0RF10_9BACT|nr:DNA alkylation repair enzyme [Gemmatirosa kalamazoonensis]
MVVAPPAVTLQALVAEVRALADPARAEGAARFFRVGPGQYGEGDRFLGLTVPQVRRLARSHRTLPFHDVVALLRSEWHEERLLAILLLVDAHDGADAELRRRILDVYLSPDTRVDNWDLVDASAARIVGPHVSSDDVSLLDRLASAPSLWHRRIAMIATLHHIRLGEMRPALHIAERLLDDGHDLIHKAVGWMLRETWHRDAAAAEGFMRRHYARLPRTTLRYAIERFPEPRRRRWLTGDLA